VSAAERRAARAWPIDRDLVVRARKGDRDAFSQLVASRIARFDGIARLITREPEQAKDAVQETFARAWRDFPALRDPDRIDAWPPSSEPRSRSPWPP